MLEGRILSDFACCWVSKRKRLEVQRSCPSAAAERLIPRQFQPARPRPGTTNGSGWFRFLILKQIQGTVSAGACSTPAIYMCHPPSNKKS